MFGFGWGNDVGSVGKGSFISKHNSSFIDRQLRVVEDFVSCWFAPFCVFLVFRRRDVYNIHGLHAHLFGNMHRVLRFGVVSVTLTLPVAFAFLFLIGA